MSRVTRRTLLRGIVSTATVGLLAGCSSDDSEDTGGGGTDDTSDESTGDESTGDGEEDTDGDDGEETDSEQTDGDDGSESETQPTETVRVGPDTQNVFDPDSLEIEAGTEVTFVWDSSGHSLLVDNQPDGADWSGVSDTQSSGHEHVHVFDVPGTYDYYCEPHQTFGMEASITVTEA